MNLFKLFGVIDVRFADILDIFLVSIVAYYVFLLFRGTRAVQMFVGGGLLLIGWFLAQWWELHTVVWLLSNLATLGIIAIVILFQPEIRGALTRIGQSVGRMNLKNLFFHQRGLALVAEARRDDFPTFGKPTSPTSAISFISRMIDLSFANPPASAKFGA